MSNPNTALPSGHCRANGLNCSGRVGGLFGLGISWSHPERHWEGIQGWHVPHHLVRMSNRMGEMIGASEFQMIPGAQLGATAFPVGMRRIAAVRALSVKGTPGGAALTVAGMGVPAQVFSTNLVSSLRSSEIVIKVPNSFLNCIFLLGTLGENLWMISNSFLVSCCMAAVLASCKISSNFCLLSSAACLR